MTTCQRCEVPTRGRRLCGLCERVLRLGVARPAEPPPAPFVPLPAPEVTDPQRRTVRVYLPLVGVVCSLNEARKDWPREPLGLLNAGRPPRW